MEDDTALRLTLADLLAGRGYVVATSPDGGAALHRLQQEPFDLLLTDLAMPRMGGDELLRNVKAAHPSLPVIVMSGSASGPVREHLVQAGAACFVAKPLRLLPLLDAIARALDIRGPSSEQASKGSELHH